MVSAPSLDGSRVVIASSSDDVLEEDLHRDVLQLTHNGSRHVLSKAEMTDLCLAPEGQCKCAQDGASEDAPCWRVSVSSCCPRKPWWSLSSQLLPDNQFTQLLRQHVAQTAASQHSSPVLANETCCGSASGSSCCLAKDTPPTSTSQRAGRPGASPPCAQNDIAESAAPASHLQRAPAALDPARVRGSRTPSPDCSYQAVRGCALLPPRLLLAPPPSEVPAKEVIDDRRCRAEGNCQAGVRKARRRARVRTLQTATQLRRLDDQDPECVITVRRIAPLGFAAEGLLRAHFEEIAGSRVEEILLSGCEAPQKNETAVTAHRVRPSGYCFVRMREPEAVETILRQGVMQTVNGVEIQIQRFRARGQEEQQ